MNSELQGRIVTMTLNPAVDTSGVTDSVVPEHKLRVRDVRRDPGGGGLNVSRAVHKLGGTSTAVYFSGGPPGLMLEQLLLAEGVLTSPVRTSGFTRDNLTVAEELSGAQFRFVMPGASVTPSELQECMDAVFALSPQWVVFSGSMPEGVGDDFFEQLVRRTREAGARLVVDTSGPPLRHALKAGAFLIKPNFRELNQLAGRTLRDNPEIDAFVDEMIRSGQVEVVLLSLGAGGARLHTREMTEHIVSPTVPIVSAVGAGDSTVAGMVLALAQGRSIRDAARFGVAAGAAAVMTPGTELCRGEDARRLYEQMSG